MSETIQDSEVGRQTRPEQVTEPSLLVRSAELRDRARTTAGATEDLHDDVQQFEIDTKTYALESVDTTTLLETLAEIYNFSWALLARVAGVTPTAVRKWRRGEAVTASRHQAIAELVAFCQLLPQVDPRVEDIPFWLETPVATDTTLTRLDLYRLGNKVELLNIAAGRLGAHAALDRLQPNWRATYGRDPRFETVVHEDGSATIVMRSGETPGENRRAGRA
jgi:hypothetical protein